MKKTDKQKHVTKQELDKTKQELLEKMDNLVTRDEFHKEVKRLDGSIEVLANQVGKNTVELGTLSGEVTGLRGEVNDLRGEVTDLRGEVNDLRGEVTDLRTEMHDKFNTVLTAIDGLAGQISDSRTEKAAGEHTFRRHEKKLDDHEGRIVQLEQKAK